MIYKRDLLLRLSNKHLEKYNTSLEEAVKENLKKPWWDRYPFHSEAEELQWTAWAQKEVRKVYPLWDEDKLEQEFNVIHMICAPASAYLFKTQGQLF